MALEDNFPKRLLFEETGIRFSELHERAKRGERPLMPDFTAPTHAAGRKKLAELVAYADADDLAGLRAVIISPAKRTTQDRQRQYRDDMVTYLEGRRL